MRNHPYLTLVIAIGVVILASNTRADPLHQNSSSIGCSIDHAEQILVYRRLLEWHNLLVSVCPVAQARCQEEKDAKLRRAQTEYERCLIGTTPAPTAALPEAQDKLAKLREQIIVDEERIELLRTMTGNGDQQLASFEKTISALKQKIEQTNRRAIATNKSLRAVLAILADRLTATITFKKFVSDWVQKDLAEANALEASLRQAKAEQTRLENLIRQLESAGQPAPGNPDVCQTALTTERDRIEREPCTSCFPCRPCKEYACNTHQSDLPWCGTGCNDTTPISIRCSTECFNLALCDTLEEVKQELLTRRSLLEEEYCNIGELP